MSAEETLRRVREVVDAWGAFGAKAPINNAANAMHAIQTLLAAADTRDLNAAILAAEPAPEESDLTIAYMCGYHAGRKSAALGLPPPQPATEKPHD